ncbi:MAG TPA: hypothetical protein VHD31_01320 [Candidatus Paceibacterota bacterium]|nr:hypothetical protein [Candidatus Paceibacterota bacterium]
MNPRNFFVGRAIGFIVVLVLVGGYFLFNSYIYQQKQGPVLDYKNTTYTVEGEVVQLTNGMSEVEAAPGSASKVTTKYFGNEAKGDLNADGIPDIAFLLTQNSGGSGTFYYVVASLQDKDSGYLGTNAVLLGDRIAPQTTEIKDGEIIVNYANRAPGDPMTAPPSVGVSKYLRVDNGVLVETVQ